MGKRGNCEDTHICGVVSQPGVGNGGGDTPVTLITFPVTFDKVKFGANPLRLKGGRVTIVTSGSRLIQSGTVLSLGTFGTGIQVLNGGYSFTIVEDDFVNFWVAVGLITQASRTFSPGTSIQFMAFFEG
jgi:hypothetical protein